MTDKVQRGEIKENWDKQEWFRNFKQRYSRKCWQRLGKYEELLEGGETDYLVQRNMETQLSVIKTYEHSKHFLHYHIQ